MRQTLEQRIAREAPGDARQLARLQKEAARPKRRLYLWYMLLILTLIYIVDELTTSLHATMLSDINLDFLAGTTDAGLINQGLSKFSLMEMLANALLIVSMFYKVLADKYGRKIFLVINTLGMALGLFVCFCSTNFWIYVIGFFIIRFFVTPDQQIIYIFEIVPEKRRGTIFSLTKGIAVLGLVGISLLRWAFMGGDIFGAGASADYTKWRYVFLVPAIAGFIVALLALLFARESDDFLSSRIAYLKLSQEEKAALLKGKENQAKAQGGFANALKLTWNNKQLRYICLATLAFTMCRTITSYYTPIMSNGYIAAFSAAGMDYEAAKQAASANVSKALFVFPFSCAIITCCYGLFSDRFGRKATSIVLLSGTVVSFTIFALGVYLGWPIYLVGAFLGLFLGCFWANSDTLALLAGESSPTNLRASVLSAQSLYYGVGMVLSMGLGALFTKTVPNLNLSIFCLCLSVPCFAAALIILISQVKETKGLVLEAGKTIENA